MNAPKFMIMNILRIITPEEIGEITTKHNGGKFLSLTDLIDERLEKNVYKDFGIAEDGTQHEAKIIPFRRGEDYNVGDSGAERVLSEESTEEVTGPNEGEELVEASEANEIEVVADSEKIKEHDQSENMSSFILIEKERFKRSQQVLKRKEIMELYQQTAKVELEQIRHANQNLASGILDGVLINKKQY